MSFSGRFLLVGAHALLMAMSSFSAPLYAQMGDEAVLADIRGALGKAEIEGLTVERAGANVKLTGQVRNVFHKNEALEIALSYDEVEGVDADIEISQAESDQKLGEEVVQQLRRYSRFTIFDDASAYIEAGRVALVGWVTEGYKKQELEKRLRDILGIQEFRNDIEILPISISDDNLRQNLARRLYRDSMFSDFASMPIPPIHIIVSRSRVILTGIVNNRLMKQKAEAIIRQTHGVLSVESRLRIGS